MINPVFAPPRIGTESFAALTIAFVKLLATSSTEIWDF